MSAAVWVVVCDDEVWSFATRQKAREYATSLRRHPSNVDIRRRGGYRNADGDVRVLRREDWRSEKGSRG